jgi:meiotically up-regulated gene 157 (Mug157) protein
MSKSLFRPSDDAVTLPFLIPANAMAVVELCHTATMCRHADSPVFDLEIASSATALAIEIEQALMKYGVAVRSASQGGTMFAYEADGFGGQTFMDDANVPSLLSLPYLGFISRTDPIYAATRAFILSPRNPYYFAGSAGAGVGGPHEGMNMVWPMSLIMTALTSNSDAEIVQCLNTLKSTTASTYFVHESFNKNNASIFTRTWFAWVCTFSLSFHLNFSSIDVFFFWSRPMHCSES